MKHTTLAAITTLVLPTLALAATAFDTDGDGVLSLQEILVAHPGTERGGFCQYGCQWRRCSGYRRDRGGPRGRNSSCFRRLSLTANPDCLPRAETVPFHGPTWGAVRLRPMII